MTPRHFAAMQNFGRVVGYDMTAALALVAAFLSSRGRMRSPVAANLV